MCKWWAQGFCARGEECWFKHGVVADPPPRDPLALTARRARRLSASARVFQPAAAAAATTDVPTNETVPSPPISPDLILEPTEEQPQCHICLHDTPATYGLLEGCSHAYCLSCIRQWRDTRAPPSEDDDDFSEGNNRKTCPLCRKQSLYIIPSSVFHSAGQAKDLATARFKDVVAKKPCKHFEATKGTARGPWCRYGDECFYAHVLKEGKGRYEFGGGFKYMLKRGEKDRKAREQRQWRAHVGDMVRRNRLERAMRARPGAPLGGLRPQAARAQDNQVALAAAREIAAAAALPIAPAAPGNRNDLLDGRLDPRHEPATEIDALAMLAVIHAGLDVARGGLDPLRGSYEQGDELRANAEARERAAIERGEPPRLEEDIRRMRQMLNDAPAILRGDLNATFGPQPRVDPDLAMRATADNGRELALIAREVALGRRLRAALAANAADARAVVERAQAEVEHERQDQQRAGRDDRQPDEAVRRRHIATNRRVAVAEAFDAAAATAGHAGAPRAAEAGPAPPASPPQSSRRSQRRRAQRAYRREQEALFGSNRGDRPRTISNDRQRPAITTAAGTYDDLDDDADWYDEEDDLDFESEFDMHGLGDRYEQRIQELWMYGYRFDEDPDEYEAMLYEAGVFVDDGGWEEDFLF